MENMHKKYMKEISALTHLIGYINNASNCNLNFQQIGYSYVTLRKCFGVAFC